MKMKITLGIIFCGLIVACIFYIFTREIEVETIQPQKDTITSTISEPGYVQVENEKWIYTPIYGRIIKSNAFMGKSVKKDEVIFVLENTDMDSQLASINQEISEAETELGIVQIDVHNIKTNLGKARNDHNRNHILLEKGSISKVNYEITQNNVKKLESLLASKKKYSEGLKSQINILISQQDILNTKIKHLNVTSPINGKILTLPVKEGQIITQGYPLAQVGSMDTMVIKADLLSDDMGDVKIGQKVIINSPILKGKVLEGIITKIDPKAQERISSLGVVQRRVPITIAYENNSILQPGYEVNLSIQTATSENIVSPSEAIYLNKSNEYEVRIVENNVVKYCKITPGIRTQNYIEIKEGLKGSEQIILNGSLDIKEGTKVKIKPLE